MKMTFDQYIQNPMGVKNAVFSNREMYRNMYTERLNKLLVREGGKIEYYLYKGKKKYYAYLKIPSETVEKFYYDVVIEFSEPEGKSPRSLRDYNVRFYSNDPSFVFTFAHAFIKNELFINEYKDKMSREAVTQNADEKNPTNQVGYVKSLFFAYLIMGQKGLFNKLFYTGSYSERTVKGMIMNASEKIALRQELGEEAAKKKKKGKKQPEKVKTPTPTVKQQVNRITHTRTVNAVKTTKKSGNIKTTKTVKRK